MRTSEQDEKAATLVADWWAEKLEYGDRKAFRSKLRLLVLEKLAASPGEDVLVSTDYDPDDTLKAALNATGIDPYASTRIATCDGLLPRKSLTRIRDLKIEIKYGYGNWKDPISLD